MKLPAVAIAAAFACGIALGLYSPVVAATTTQTFLVRALAIAACLTVGGIVLASVQRLILGAVASLLTWSLLGLLSAGIAQQPRSPDYIVRLIDEGRLDLHSPLRWHGRLRDEPARLPWALAYDLDLTSVDVPAALPLQGGMRLSFAPHEGEPAIVDLHAGDEVAVITQARRPQVFRDEGAFDHQAYLATQNIDLAATLRAPQLIERVSSSKPTASILVAHLRNRLRDQLDTLFGTRPQVAGVLRAMLLGDRTFVDRDEVTDFQKTGVFHVLVVAGLHVGALAALLFWTGRKLRLSPTWTILLTLALLGVYVAIVEQRPPVLRAGLMAAAFVIGGFFYRRLDVLNSAAVAALILLIARPLALRDSSFQLSFLAIGCIGGLALPWLERTTQPYARALRGWRDITRDAAHEPRVAQFRIDLRSTLRWISARVPARAAITTEDVLTSALSFTFHAWNLFVLTIVLQIGMLPLMARDFHRITLAAPLVNLLAVPLTGLIVPLGFVATGMGFLFPWLGRLLATPLAWLTLLLLHVVQWFAHSSRWSYRIPGPRAWLILTFFVAAILLAATLRLIGNLPRRLSHALCAALVACAVLIALFPFAPQWSPGKLEATILDVGQGDSIFVVSPKGQTLLIDGGGAFRGFPGREEHGGIDPGEEAVSPYLWSRGYKSIDVVALTHAHQDHLGGLTAILENFQVRRLWIGREVASPALARLEELARAKHIPIEHETRGQTFTWSGTEGQFFWPAISSSEVAPSAQNNDSLVFRLRYGNRAILLPGDAEKGAERAILSQTTEQDLQADVLKVGHHGSKNSTTPDFLAAVKPEMAIISAGEENPYGHPSPVLLDRLETAGIRILRTDRDGAIHVLTDGTKLEVTCFVRCPEPPTRDALRHGEPHAPDHEENHQ